MMTLWRGKELDGEDALGPQLRHLLDEAKVKVQSINGSLKVFGEPLELSEPDDEHIQLTKEPSTAQGNITRGWAGFATRFTHTYAPSVLDLPTGLLATTP